MVKLGTLALAGIGFILARRSGLFGGTPDQSASQIFRLPAGSTPIPLVDSGLVVGGGGELQAAVGEGFPIGLDPATGQQVFIDPQLAIATGSGIFSTPSGFARFGSGGFVKLTEAGTGIAGTTTPSGGIFGVTGVGGEIVPASFEDPKVLQEREETTQTRKTQIETARDISSGQFTPIGGSEKLFSEATTTIKKKETPKVITDLASFFRFF